MIRKIDKHMKVNLFCLGLCLPFIPWYLRENVFRLRTELKLLWAALREIPYGETRSYRDIAEAIGHPKAYRAVGMANNANPLFIIIPCHRVIGADGSLTGYGGGLPMKKALLMLEKKHSIS